MSEVVDDAVDTAPVETPAALPADTPIGTPPAPADDDLQSLLDQYDAATSKPEPEPATLVDAPQSADDLDKLLADLGGPTAEQKQIEQLTGELNSVRAAELERHSRADFDGFSRKLQSDLGPHVPEDYARTQLLSMAVENPALEQAWRHRHVTDEQLRAADAEFNRLKILYHQVQQAPDDGRKPAALAQIEARSWELGLMLQSRQLLNKAWRDVQKRASRVAPMIDLDATADRDGIIQAIRDGGSGRGIPPEPPVNLGRMTNAEYRDYLGREYNISGF